MAAESGIVGKILTPAIGVSGFGFCQEVVVEYSSNANVTLSTLAADTGNGSYGAADITLPSTGGGIAKTKFLVSTNKWKLAWWQFTFSDSTFRVFTEGFAVRVKSWGTKEAYTYKNPFQLQNPYYPDKGGFGGQQ